MTLIITLTRIMCVFTVDMDAKAYETQYNGLTQFAVCCVCAIEDSATSMHDFCAEEHSTQRAFLKDAFQNNLNSTVEDQDEHYAAVFYNVITKELVDGKLPNVTTVCASCLQSLTATKKSKASLPKESLLCGLLQGAVPAELKELTTVEKSMISIYSSVTKASIQSGKHFHTKGATTYTIVNDLTSVANTLPRKPDIDSFAILKRKRNGYNSSKEFTFRPSRVKDALLWLKLHNHLYKDVKLNWYHDVAFTWADSTRNDVPCLELDSDDEEGIDIELGEALDERVSTNSGTSGNDTEVLAMTESTIVDSALQEMRDIIKANGNVPAMPIENASDTVAVMTDAFQFVTPYKNPQWFLSKCFPTLFPYGRGCPSDPKSTVSCFADHCRLMLRRAGGNEGRRFQNDPNYYFSMYSYEVKRKVGGVAFQAQKEQLDEHDESWVEDVTAGQMKEIIDYVEEATQTTPEILSKVKEKELTADEIKKYISRMVPFSTSLKGTPLHIAHERKKLLAMIASPLLKELGSWRWFVTFAPADNYDMRLFEVCASKDSRLSWQQRSKVARELSLEERIEVLKLHPALAARLFDLKQKCLWDSVIQGKARPFGEILDTWRRVEFQLRGTPHVHALLSIIFDGIGTDDALAINPEILERLKELIDATVTASLESRPCNDCSEIDKDLSPAEQQQTMLEESDYNFNIPWEGYFDDKSDPRCAPFETQESFARKPDGTFQSAAVHSMYRRLQLANQMHRCTKTCFKYLLQHEEQVCRFGFPFKQGEKTSMHNTTFREERDKRSRMRMYALPKRNNAYVNNTAMSPLLAIAHGGNHDIKYIDCPYGTAEYAASYSAKAESADFKVLKNLLAKKLIHAKTDRDHLRAVGTALVQSTQIGAVQACYTLLGLDFVISSRVVINVNPLHRSQMRKSMISRKSDLETMLDTDSVMNGGFGSQLGRRRAYQQLVQQQRAEFSGECTITFFTMLTYFSLNPPAATRVYTSPPLLELDKTGKPTNAPKTFKVGDVVFSLKKQPVVVNLTPHIPLDYTEERSCYAVLLLHYPWPLAGEADLLHPYSTAVDALQYVVGQNLFSDYVLPALQFINKSETAKSNNTNPTLEGNNADKSSKDSAHDIDHSEVESDDEQQLYADTCDDVISMNTPLPELSTGHPVATNISDAVMGVYKSFLPAALREFNHQYSLDNQSDYNTGGQLASFIPVQNAENRLLAVQDKIRQLRPLQLEAFNKAVSHISGAEPTPLLMFTTGEGGTGKSNVIQTLAEHMRVTYGKQPGIYGSVIVAAPTGTSANNIDGFTWQSVLGKSIASSKRTDRVLSDQTARKVGQKIKGAKLMILDEISLVSLESLYVISESLKLALSANTEDAVEKRIISQTPFGGMHMFIAGDLWQLRCVSETPIYNASPMTFRAKEGKKLWMRLNEFVELEENCRFINAELSLFARFLKQGRVATPKNPVENRLLDYMNTRVCLGVKHAQAKAAAEFGNEAIWIAETNEAVNKFNSAQLQQLISEGCPSFRSVARHTPVDAMVGSPNSIVKAGLLAIIDKDCMSYFDFAVGSRVRCTRNVATQIGIFNGATGTVIGFGFYGAMPSELHPKVNTLHLIVNREIPVVLVRMDKYEGIPLYKNDPKVVPFTEISSNTTYKFMGYRYNRWQLPLALASAITTHRSQSLTAHNGAVIEPSNGAPFARGLPYVSCSRTTDISKLLLLRPLTHAHFESNEKDRMLVAAEYERLRLNFLDVNN